MLSLAALLESVDDGTWAATFAIAAGDEADATGWDGGAAGAALLEAAGVAVEVFGEAGDDIRLIATMIFLAAVDCSLSDLVPQFSIATGIYQIKCKLWLFYCKFIYEIVW